MKEMKEFLLEVFDPMTIGLIIVTFIGSFLVGLFIDDSFLITMRDSCLITVSLGIIVVYVKYLQKNKLI